MIGGNLMLFLHPPELLGVWFVPIGLIVSSFGFKRFSQASESTWFFAKPSTSDQVVLKRWIFALVLALTLAEAIIRPALNGIEEAA